MTSETQTDILTQIDQRREEIAEKARTYLKQLHFDYPEVQYLTLSLKHKFGYSTLKVYSLKSKENDHGQAAQEDDDRLIENPFS